MKTNHKQLPVNTLCGIRRSCSRHVAVVALLCLFLALSFAEADASAISAKRLDELKKTMQEAPRYRQHRLHELDSMKRVLRGIPRNDWGRRSAQALAIGYSYRTFIADSALTYFRKAEQYAHRTDDTLVVDRARIGVLAGLSTAGIFPEALSLLHDLEGETLDNSTKISLWTAARQLYAYMMGYLGDHSSYGRGYRQKYLEYDDSLLRSLPQKSTLRKFLYSERLIYGGNYKLAKVSLQEILDSLPVENNLYGMAAYQMAEACREQGDEAQYVDYLALAAMSDMKGCVNEGWALPILAAWLYENGKLDEAFDYINSSLSDALNANARMRMVEIARLVPGIDEAYRKKLRSTNSELVVYIILVSFLLIISAVLVVVLTRQMKRSRAVQRKLAQTSRLQEEYIGNFVGLCSSYSSQLESWHKMVSRKIAAGQTDEILKAIKSGKTSDENEDFHDVIDKAFLSIYPDFMENVNRLLRPEERIEPRKDGKLPSEIRILALMRLGVEESTRIATILQYSPNTVYTYRNKMRNKAIRRDTFEKDIMRIGYIDV